jgi:hypothetical protein
LWRFDHDFAIQTPGGQKSTLPGGPHPLRKLRINLKDPYLAFFEAGQGMEEACFVAMEKVLDKSGKV